MSATAHTKPLTPAQLWCIEHIPFTPEHGKLTCDEAHVLYNENKKLLNDGFITLADFDSACEDLAAELTAE